MPVPSELERGLRLFGERRYEQALECFTRTLAADPGNETAFVKKTAALLRLRRLAEARTTLYEALRLHPQSPRLLPQLNLLGCLWLKEEEYAQAREVFEAALFVRPKNRAALAWRINSMHWDGKLKEERAALDTALSYYPRSPRLHQALIRLAGSYLVQEKYALSLEAYERVLGLDAKNAEALAGKLLSQGLSGRDEEALKTAAAAIELVPRERLLSALGEFTWNLTEPNQRRAFELMFTIDPDNELAILGRAGSFRSLGKFEEARQILERAIEAGHSGDLILQGLSTLAQSHLSRDQYDAALELFERMRAVDARSAQAVAGQAVTLWLLGKRRQSRDWLDPARSQVPWARLREGLIEVGHLLRYGAPKKAVVAYDLVLMAEPGDAVVLNERAEVIQWAGDDEGYRAAVDEALRRVPEDEWLLGKLRGIAGSDYNAGHLDRALRTFERLLVLVPGDTSALRWRAATLRRLGVADKAGVALAEAVANHPEDAGLLAEQGRTYRHVRRFDEALTAFDKAIAVRPPLIDAPLGKADCLRRLHRYDEALKVLAEALARPGYEPETYAYLHHERALIFSDTREFSKAEAALAEAMAVAPYWSRPNFDRAEMLLRLGRRPEAQELIDVLEQNSAASPRVQRDLGWYYLRHHAPGKACEKFESLPQGTLDRETGLGGVCVYREDYSAADRHFVRARELSPWEPTALVNLAWALVSQEVPSLRGHAEALFREALVLDPENAYALGGLGVLAAWDGRLQEAEGLFLTANHIDPSHGAHLNLATLYVQEGRCREAREQLDLSLQYEPDDTTSWIELGNLHWQLGEQREALQALRRAAAIEPDSVEPVRALALALMHAGDATEAERLLRQGLQRADRARSWRLHLALAQVLRTTADRSSDTGLYEEARQEVQQALKLREDDDLWFELGYILAKLDDLDGALAVFEKCGEDHVEAKRNAARIRATLDARKVQTRGGRFGSLFLGAATLAQMLAVWVLFLLGRFKDESKLLAFIPILLALFAVAALLPWLTRLKLPGIEAELAEPKQSLTPGPKGGIALSSAVPTITWTPAAGKGSAHALRH